MNLISCDPYIQQYLDFAKRWARLTYGPPTLYVSGEGPYRAQIERMAKEIPINVIDTDDAMPNSMAVFVDDMSPLGIGNALTSWDEPIPCDVEGLGVMVEPIIKDNERLIRVLGRGRLAALTAAYLSRRFDREVSIQSARSESYGEASVFVNCSDGEVKPNYPPDATVVDVHKIGRLTTAILLSRASLYPASFVDIV